MKNFRETFLMEYIEFINLMNKNHWAWINSAKGEERRKRINKLGIMHEEILNLVLNEKELEKSEIENKWNELSRKYLIFIKEEIREELKKIR